MRPPLACSCLRDGYVDEQCDLCGGSGTVKEEYMPRCQKSESVFLTILEEAQDLTRGDRNADYGHPLDDYACTAEMQSAYLRKKVGLRADLSAEDSQMLMILAKISREANRHKRDNLTDIAGYADCIQRTIEEKERRVRMMRDAMRIDNERDLPCV